MIKIRNQHDLLIDLSVPGAQSAATDKKSFVIPFNGFLRSIFAKLGSAGVTGSQIVEVKKNGVTIFSNATKLTFATGVQACTYGPLTTDPTPVSKGDIITVDVTQIHTTPAKNLNLLLVLSRKAAGTTETDTIGVRDE